MKPKKSGTNPTLIKNSDQLFPIYCVQCGSTNLIKYGKELLPHSKIEQRYQCKDCHHIFWERTWGDEVLDQ